MPAKVYTDKDADLKHLQNKTLAVLGFGSQGHAHALNLKDSGCKVIIGLYEGSKSIPVAKSKGFEVVSTARSGAAGGRDFRRHSGHQTGRRLIEQDIAPNLAPGKTLLFSHGFSIHFKTVVPPNNVNVILVAPKGPGHIVRRQYLEGKGVPSLIGIYQDPAGTPSKSRWPGPRALAPRAPACIQTTFKEETETDLFGEQTVLCGGASALIQAGFETLVEAGYQPEMAYFECLHELKLIVDLMNEAGISGMRFSVSETAKWGDVSVGPKIIDASRQETDEGRPEGHPVRQIRQRLDHGIQQRLQEIQRPAQSRRKPSRRKSRPAAARLDALDEEALRQRRPGRLLSRAHLSFVEWEFQ